MLTNIPLMPSGLPFEVVENSDAHNDSEHSEQTDHSPPFSIVADEPQTKLTSRLEIVSFAIGTHACNTIDDLYENDTNCKKVKIDTELPNHSQDDSVHINVDTDCSMDNVALDNYAETLKNTIENSLTEVIQAADIIHVVCFLGRQVGSVITPLVAKILSPLNKPIFAVLVQSNLSYSASINLTNNALETMRGENSINALIVLSEKRLSRLHGSISVEESTIVLKDEMKCILNSFNIFMDNKNNIRVRVSDFAKLFNGISGDAFFVNTVVEDRNVGSVFENVEEKLAQNSFLERRNLTHAHNLFVNICTSVPLTLEEKDKLEEQMSNIVNNAKNIPILNCMIDESVPETSLKITALATGVSFDGTFGENTTIRPIRDNSENEQNPKSVDNQESSRFSSTSAVGESKITNSIIDLNLEKRVNDTSKHPSPSDVAGIDDIPAILKQQRN